MRKVKVTVTVAEEELPTFLNRLLKDKVEWNTVTRRAATNVKLKMTVKELDLLELLDGLSGAGIRWNSIVPIVGRQRPSAEYAEVVYQLLAKGRTVRDISEVTSVSKSTVSNIGRDPQKYGLSHPPIGRNVH